MGAAIHAHCPVPRATTPQVGLRVSGPCMGRLPDRVDPLATPFPSSGTAAPEPISPLTCRLASAFESKAPLTCRFAPSVRRFPSLDLGSSFAWRFLPSGLPQTTGGGLATGGPQSPCLAFNFCVRLVLASRSLRMLATFVLTTSMCFGVTLLRNKCPIEYPAN